MASSSSLSSAKLFSSFISTAITRRGFAAASAAEGVVSSGGARSGAAAMAKTKRTGEEKMGNKKSETVSWVPDPVTGCYRPENQLLGNGDVDAAELRAVLLNQKN